MVNLKILLDNWIDSERLNDYLGVTECDPKSHIPIIQKYGERKISFDIFHPIDFVENSIISTTIIVT